VILLCSGGTAAISGEEFGKGEVSEGEFGGEAADEEEFARGWVSGGDTGGGKVEFARVSPVTLFNPILAMRAKAVNTIRK
jgi:hypothetical protein